MSTATSLPKFGDYISVEMKRYGAPNEHYEHKVIGTIRSNAFTDVPVQAGANKPYAHEGGLVEVVVCVCCGVSEDEVVRYRVSDVKITRTTPSAEAQTFSYFKNHGDEDGRNEWTISYGDMEESDNIIVGCDDTEEDAKESVKRLNEIIESNFTARLAALAGEEGPTDSALYTRFAPDSEDEEEIYVCTKMLETAKWMRDQMQPIIVALREENSALSGWLSLSEDRVRKLEAAIRKAIDIKDLWVYDIPLGISHIGEAHSLQSMYNDFTSLLAPPAQEGEAKP